MNTETLYRNTSVGGASLIGMMIALFDALARDLRRAAIAIRNEDIEGRCKQLNHALQVIAQLDSWVDLEHGGQPARQLRTFYAYLRSKIMEASVKKSASLMEAQMEIVLHVRSKWQLMDSAPAPSEVLSAVPADAAQPPVVDDAMAERIPLSFSA